MRSDKNSAIQLRKSGKSYSQISVLLNIPKSTLSSWLKDIPLSKKARLTIEARRNYTGIAKLIQRNKLQTELAKERHDKTYELAKEEAKILLTDSLFIAGTSLYWAEGYKQGAYGSKWKSIDFSNSDPEMIKLMMLFFIKFLDINVSNIKIQIMLHNPDHVDKAIDFWHNITKVPKDNFIKTCHCVSKASSGKTKRKLEYGTAQIRINNVNNFFRLIGWIDGLKEKFI